MANTQWTVSASESWCSITPATGSATLTVVVKALSANTATTARQSILSFKSGERVLATLTVKQQGSIISPPIYITTLAEFNTAQSTAQPGSTITWANGTYTFGGTWTISKDGICVKAQTDGEVVFTGALLVRVHADDVVFRGFQFRNNTVDATSPSTYEGRVDMFVVGNGISNSGGNTNATKGNRNQFLHLNFYGAACRQMMVVTPGASGNLFEYCNFEAKKTVPKNAVFQIQVSANKPGNNIVRYCSFKNHFAPETGDYGMEAVRIGYSHQKENISRDLVEYCYFYRCCGDDEVISSKATEVIYRYNTFDDNGPNMTGSGGINYNGQGHLSIRHGHKTVSYGNFFTKDRGLRVCEGSGHVVYNNYFSNSGTRWPFRIDNRDENSGLNFADPVNGLILAHNTFVNCAPMELEAGRTWTTMPANIVVVNNLYAGHSSSSFTRYWTGNEFCGGHVIDRNTTINKPSSGLTYVSTMADYTMTNTNGYIQLKQSTSGMAASSSNYTLPSITGIDIDANLILDIVKNPRPADKTQKHIGCFQYGGTSNVPPYTTAANTGPGYLR
jgi:poly(beta-D-mannuronate) lyase